MSSLNWTVLDHRRLVYLNGWNRTVEGNETGRSKKVKQDSLKKWGPLSHERPFTPLNRSLWTWLLNFRFSGSILTAKNMAKNFWKIRSFRIFEESSLRSTIFYDKLSLIIYVSEVSQASWKSAGRSADWFTLFINWVSVKFIEYVLDLTFYVKVKRYQYYPVMTLVVPCVMTAMLIVLTFILPPDAGEKVGLSKYSKFFILDDNIC